MSTELTNAEETLIIALANIAARRAGSFASELGHPEPTDEQSLEMGRLQTQALLNFVVGLRDAEAPPSQEALSELVEGAAQGAVLRVLGQSPEAQKRAN